MDELTTKAPREFAKIKLQGPFASQAEYKKLYAREYRRVYGKDGDRIDGYRGYVKQYNHEYRRRVGKKERKNRQTKEQRALLRTEILYNYSGGKMVCSRCGFDDVRALDLDHIENGGGSHRKQIGRRGATYDIYAALKRDNFPSGYQVLCRNCNWIKEIERREVMNLSAGNEDKTTK